MTPIYNITKYYHNHTTKPLGYLAVLRLPKVMIGVKIQPNFGKNC